MAPEVRREIADPQAPVGIPLLRAADLVSVERAREALRPGEVLVSQLLGRARRVVVQMQKPVHLQLGGIGGERRHLVQHLEPGLELALARERHAQQVPGIGADHAFRRHGLEQGPDGGEGFLAEQRVGQMHLGFGIVRIELEEVARGPLEGIDVHRGQADPGEVLPPVEALGRQLDGALEREDRLVVAPQERQQLAGQRMARGDLGRRPAGTLGGIQRSFEGTRRRERPRQAFEGQRLLRGQLERLAMQLDRLVEPAPLAQALGEIGDQARIPRPELDRPPRVPLRRVEPAQPAEGHAQQVVRVGVLGLRLQQPPAAALGKLRVTVPQLALRLEQQAEVGRRPGRRAGRARKRPEQRRAALRPHGRGAGRSAGDRPRPRTRAASRPGGRCRSAAAP